MLISERIENCKPGNPFTGVFWACSGATAIAAMLTSANHSPLLLLFFNHSVVPNSFVTPWAVAHQLLCPWDSPSKTTGVGYHFLLQGIFLTLGSHLHLLHWQADSLSLYHLGNPHSPLEDCIFICETVGPNTFLSSTHTHSSTVWVPTLCQTLCQVLGKSQRWQWCEARGQGIFILALTVTD